MANEKDTAQKKTRKERLMEMLQHIDLDDHQRQWAEQRWADQTEWFGKNASKAKKKRNRLRLLIISGGVLLPAIPSITTFLSNTWEINDYSVIVTTIISISVAISTGIEGYFDYSDMYNRYRGTAETLKMEGSWFANLSGPYRTMKLEKAYRRFTERVEKIIGADVKLFQQVEAEREKREDAS